MRDFKVWIDTLSDGNGYLIRGKIMKDSDVVFYLPFEPTVKDFSMILRNFRKKHSITDSFSFKTLIQPARYKDR